MGCVFELSHVTARNIPRWLRTTTQPITIRTTTITNGTVRYVQGNYVIITLENGENREYNLPDGFTFTSEGKPATAKELHKEMKVSATKIVSEPTADITAKTVVTGKSRQ